jgi:hypothetical protein
MTPTPLLIAIALFLTALLLWITREKENEELSEDGSSDSVEMRFPDGARRAEIVSRVFSSQDEKFISHLDSPRLRRMYQQERRRVALHWVLRTSRDVTRIMSAHRLASRQIQDLDVRTETKLFFQYLRLRLTCALLVLLIKLFGPHFLSDLASHASELYRGIGRVLTEGSLARVAAEDTTTH